LTNAVKTLTGKPRYEETLATLLSALVACILNISLQWNGCEFTGVNRSPMLVATSREYFFDAVSVIS
jgi:hypothetical protein